MTRSLYIAKEETIYIGLSNGEIHALKKKLPAKV